MSATKTATTQLRLALDLDDPEERCLALLRLLPKLEGRERTTALRAATAAAKQVPARARREALLRRLQATQAKRSGTKKTGAKKGPAKKAGAKRRAPKKAGAKKAAAKRPAAKKTAAKRSGKRRPGAKKRSRPPESGAAAGLESLLVVGKVLHERPSAASPASIPAATKKRPPESVVNLGFSDWHDPGRPLDPRYTLRVSTDYYFWLEIGEEVEYAIATDVVELPTELLPARAELDVAVFADPNGFCVTDRRGRLQLGEDGSFTVTQPASLPDGLPTGLAHRRVFFAVKTPRTPGEYHIRFCVYCRGVLVQSHDVRAHLSRSTERRTPSALSSDLDYTLATKLDAASLGEVSEHTLSILSNDDGQGTHGFRFFGPGGDVQQSAAFDGQEVQDLINRARRTFREVSWGTAAPYSDGAVYAYATGPQIDQLTIDLGRLAKAGYRTYDSIIDRLGGSEAHKLEKLMRASGTIQLALKETARLVLPLALLYDHPLDTDAEVTDYKLCPHFARAVNVPLENHACFNGACPHREDKLVVCPGGFWGFRHAIGVPPTVGAWTTSPSELPAKLPCNGTPIGLISVSADENMTYRDEHVTTLKAMFAGGVDYADTRQTTLERLREGKAHVVYFYCHGGVDAEGTPYIQIGAAKERISRATLRSEKIQWTNVRPLVFVNGCHTTDLEPERAIELVSGFVQTARGAGVIGTEITVFEPLATRFAEEFLQAFLAGETLGKAIRIARLRLLASWNPLGLLYVPYAMATLQLSQT